MDRILKFGVVGTIGFIINTIGLLVGVRFGLRPSLAGPIGAELAIISNFVLNNLWTFSDRSITSWDAILAKFLQFNLFSLGSAGIQFIFLRIGEAIFGLATFKRPLTLLIPSLVKLPIISKIAPKISLYLVVYVFAVGVGMVVNFLIYSLVIWKQ